MDEFFALNRLSAYLDGDLSEAEAAEVARAIEQNDEVRTAWEEMQASVAFVRRHGGAVAPARFHARVMLAVEALPSPASPLARLRALLRRVPLQAAGVAAVAVLVLIVIWRLPDGAPPPPPATTREAAAPEPSMEDEAGSVEAPEAPEPVAPPLAGPVVPEEAPPSDAARNEASAADRSERVASAPAWPGATSPYIPDWETRGTAAEDVPAAPAVAVGAATRGLMEAPFVYRLYPEDPEVLRSLAALAERLGGVLLSPSGAVVDPWSLTVERNHAEVVLRLPMGNLEQVEPALRRLGGILPVQADEERLYGAGGVDVGIEVIFRP